MSSFQEVEQGEDVQIVEYQPDGNQSRAVVRESSSGDRVSSGSTTVGSRLPSHALSNTAITAGVTKAVLFQTEIPIGSLQHGWWVSVADFPEDFVQVGSLQIDSQTGNITGFTATTPFQQSHSIGVVFYWEPVLYGTSGHSIDSSITPAMYKGDPRAGATKIVKPHGGVPILYHPDGSIASAKTGHITDAQGRSLQVAPASIHGSELAAALERQGIILFDASAFASTTFGIDFYPGGYSAPGDPNFPSITGYQPGQTQYSGSYNDEYWDGATFPVVAVQWARPGSTGAPATADADHVLGFKLTNPAQGAVVGGTTYHGTEHIRWYDLGPIVDGDGSTRSYQLTHDMSISVPIFVPSGSTNQFHIGSQASVSQTIAAASTTYVYTDLAVGSLGTAAGDVWIIDAGTPLQETFTIAAAGVDTTNNRIVATANLQNAHAIGAPLKLYQSGATTIRDGFTFDGTHSLSDTYSALSNVMIGLWDGTTWWRGWWGDPTWVFGAATNTSPSTSPNIGAPPWAGNPGNQLGLVNAAAAGSSTFTIQSLVGSAPVQNQWIQLGPDVYQVASYNAGTKTVTLQGNVLKQTYSSGTVMMESPNPVYLGKLASVPGTWQKLHAKLSQIGIYAPGVNRTVQGIEISAHSVSASSGSPCSVYFDAISIGATTHKTRHPAGSATSRVLGSKAVKGMHKHPIFHADAQIHSNIQFWVDSSYVLHWTSGTIVLHDGTKITINGGSEASPNAGINALIGAQATPGGNWIVLNTGATGHIYDPIGGGTSTLLHPYSAAGGTGGQTGGFFVVSDGFDWTSPPGNRSVGYIGQTDAMLRIGQIAYAVDGVTGLYPVMSHAQAAKIHGDSVLHNAIASLHIGSGQVVGRNKAWTLCLPSTVIGTNSSVAGTTTIGSWAVSNTFLATHALPGATTAAKQALAQALDAGGWQVSLGQHGGGSSPAIWGKFTGWIPPSSSPVTTQFDVNHMPGDGTYGVIINSIVEPDPTSTTPTISIQYQLLTPGVPGGFGGPLGAVSMDLYIRWIGLSLTG